MLGIPVVIDVPLAGLREQLGEIAGRGFCDAETVKVLCDAGDSRLESQIKNIYNRFRADVKSGSISDDEHTSDRLFFIEGAVRDGVDVLSRVLGWLEIPRVLKLFYDDECVSYISLLEAKIAGSLEEFRVRNSGGVPEQPRFVYRKNIEFSIENVCFDSRDSVRLLGAEILGRYKSMFMRAQAEDIDDVDPEKVRARLKNFWDRLGDIETATIPEEKYSLLLQLTDDFEMCFLNLGAVEDFRLGKINRRQAQEIHEDSLLEKKKYFDDVPYNIGKRKYLLAEKIMSKWILDLRKRIASYEKKIDLSVEKALRFLVTGDGSIPRSIPSDMKTALELLRNFSNLLDREPLDLGIFSGAVSVSYNVELSGKDPVDSEFYVHPEKGVFDVVTEIHASDIPEKISDNTFYEFQIYQRVNGRERVLAGSAEAYGFKSVDFDKNVLLCEHILIDHTIVPVSLFPQIVSLVEDALQDFASKNDFFSVMIQMVDSEGRGAQFLTAKKENYCTAELLMKKGPYMSATLYGSEAFSSCNRPASGGILVKTSRNAFYSVV